MKKFFQRVLRVFAVSMGIGCDFCYADEIDPMFPYNLSSPRFEEPITVNIVPMIIIGVVIAVIVLIAIIILLKSKKHKEENNEK